MINKFLVAIALIILTQSIYAQALSAIDVSFSKISADDTFIAAPNVKFDVKNHNWSFGPTVFISYGDQIEERESVKLTGVYLGYENFPHGKTSKWNMFHSFDFFAQRVKDLQESQYFDLSTNSFQSNEINQIEKSFLLTGNAGVLWNISDKISATSMIGIGLNANLRNTKSDLEEFDDFFFEQIWMMKIGVRYNLNLSN